MIVNFLDVSGLLHGSIPSLRNAKYYWTDPRFQARSFGSVALVADPVHAVCLGIMKKAPKGYVAGVTIGIPWGLATLPDMLLGFVDDSGAWLWPGRHGEIVNLHAPTPFTYPKGDVWPVWMTFGDCRGPRERLILQRQAVDVSEELRRMQCERFWRESKEEFIRTTWAPQRLQWCLDSEEYCEIFSPE